MATTVPRRRRLSKKENSHASSREASAESNDETDVGIPDDDEDALTVHEATLTRENGSEFKQPSVRKPTRKSFGSGGMKTQASVVQDSAAASRAYEQGNESATTYDGDVSSANVGPSRKASIVAEPVSESSSAGHKSSHSASHYNSIPRTRPALTTSMPSETSPPSSPAGSIFAPASSDLLQPVAAKPKQPFHAPAPHGMISKVTPQALNQQMLAAIGGEGPDGEQRQYKINPPPEGRPIRIYADGVYDLFHYAHALQLRQAKLCFPSVFLLVGVVSDELVLKYKNAPVLSSEERYESVRNCKWVDEVVEEAPWEVTQEFIDKYQIDYVAHDEEPYVSLDSEDVYAYAKSIGKFLPTRRTSGISTSELLSRIVEGYRYGDYDGKLLKIGHPELMSRANSENGSSRSVRTADQTMEVDGQEQTTSTPGSPLKKLADEEMLHA